MKWLLLVALALSSSSAYAGLLGMGENLMVRVDQMKLTTTNVLTASLIVAAANPKRRGFIIFNNSANSAYVSYAGTAVASTCAKIVPTFTSFESNGPVVYRGDIAAIRNAGSGGISVWEYEQ